MMRFIGAMVAVGLLAMLALSACQPVMVEPAMTAADEGTEVNVTATDDGLHYSGMTDAGIPSGFTTFAFENELSDGEFAPTIVRLKDGVTIDEFKAAASSEDSMSAVAMITLYGGRWMQPGDSLTYETNLPPGDYVFLTQTESSNGEMKQFTVLAGDGTDDAGAPASDVAVTMQDFAFVMPDTVAAGEHIWHIANQGEQWHEMSILPVPEGTTVADIVELATGPSSVEEPEAAFQFGPISEGIDVWAQVDLEPGTYAVVCFLPDVNGDFSPHVEHGMARVFVVE